ncbi:hypothetical protein H4217_002565 [Coemansia sp. RSA 1939]|nr:hypothetical protein H4217_002565 [Coemansia sp. RSA 1939]KAJ2617509.1 hypothetical protein EV177_000544 [Coemansia sp. RSA 1804]
MEQKPWILNDTIRNNILFGRKYDKEHYNRVIEACALAEDIENWTRGDNTLIGENGINISGGQRARLALARTVYSKADIYVLDDPLSAVDAHVKRHILENVIMDSGLLGKKIRIIAVNDEKLLPYFHQVIRLEQGKALVTKQIPREYKPFAISNHKEKNIEENSDFNDSESHMKHDDDDTDKGIATEQPPASWPSSGKIEFRNFSMKYHENLEYALKNTSLIISPGAKVGVVGRTGAGKTSLTRALFRLVSKKTCEGSILIDGHDIATVSTSNLRPRLGTILQESTVFEGLFKQNLDPLMEYTIEDMWAALIKCNMNEFVEPKRDQTKKRENIVYSDYEMTVMRDIDIWDREWKESGWMRRIFLRVFVNKPELNESFDTEKTHGLDKNIGHISHLSDGQKQLFSLCRLLMREYKIIVLDEATADVDLETDKEMQRLFRSKFKHCTVLTIAHRLETIMSSDKIIVMDKGRVVEFGPPKELIKQDGHFSELVKANDF